MSPERPDVIAGSVAGSVAGSLATPGAAPVPTSELTPRALLAGVALGAVLAIGNVYMGLKSNWWDSGNIMAAVLGFALCAPGGRASGRPYSLLENNITQTTAGAAAVMPATLGLLGALPALQLMGHFPSTVGLLVWGLVLALFGILLAVPLRKRYVVDEPLAFPSAIATAELMRAIHASSQEARARTRIVLLAAVGALAFTWFRDGRPALIPGALWLPLSVAGTAASSLTLGVALSPALLGAGVLVGPRAAFSLLLGAVVAWGLLAPAVLRAGIATADYTALVAWLLWPGVALMVAAGLVGLLLRWRTFVKVAAGLTRLRQQPALGAGGLGLLLSATAVVVVGWLVFGVNPLMGAAALLLSLLLIDVCVRTAGETDIAPLSALGQLTQLVFGLLAPGPAPVNMAYAQIPTGAGVQSALTVNVLKAGHLLGAPVQRQVRAQMIGALAGLLVSLPAYTLVRATHGIGTQRLPAPGALGWKALAAVSESGTGALPPFTGQACLWAAALGVLLALLERTRAARFVPSPVAMAAAFLIPGTTSAAIALGALIWLVLARRDPTGAERFGSSAAAGVISGEALMAMGVALLTALGLLGS